MNRLIVLSNEDLGPQLLQRAAKVIAHNKITHISSKAELIEHTTGDLSATYMVSFGTGVIVPADILERFTTPPINIHPASPDFPGRDPHHFATYKSAEQYGATVHYMSELVDEGPIIAARLITLPPGKRHPIDYFKIAEEAGLALFDDIIASLAEGVLPPLSPDLKWGPNKTTRRDFNRLCRISPTIDAAELQRRINAVSFPGHDNLNTRLHGQRFRLTPLDSDDDPLAADWNNWTDFTQTEYRGLLKLAKENGYRFVSFGETVDSRHVLWRHDVDHAVHLALSLGQIEAQEDVHSTFFFCLHLPFYNMFERGVRDAAREIVKLGHDIGLHFDASFYDRQSGWTLETLERHIAQERAILEDLVDCKLTAVSFHDPNAGNMLDFDQETLSGLVNTYGRDLRSNYRYCSDSNGYWRHDTIRSVLESGAERLQILTHPVWWGLNPMPPRWRIEHTIMHIAQTTMTGYDNHLTASSRHNIES